ncbi:MarR family winged helix-turn-helix transcriptional regulator [Clostridium nigeriense]|uniref:MarR family winged helix-turn-helix transcriptional regulator n=1 Tax=Clostridium nigeriense TaxID=1805470 RepID=UPI00083060DF|nr:MarR family transcriptional regulator [Clostridium nigeriense]
MDNKLNIIDLISENHIKLRRLAEDRWLKTGEEEISHTEGFLLAKISMGKISISEAARQANISRQAMFKCAKKLELRGYLKFNLDEKNNKYAYLTDKGKEYCMKSKQLKEAIESEIRINIGEENLKILKEILNKNLVE